jgi:glutamyl-tRNA synthetase
MAGDAMSIADKIFPDAPSAAEIEVKYPPRDLPDGAKVTRAAPSPTGFMHIGNMLPFLVDERAAHSSGGVFMLRIEDTDTKRLNQGAERIITSAFEHYGIVPDEGVMADGSERGAYGPYRQDERREIYHAYIKEMLKDGRAYVDFATPEELEEIRKKQEAEGARPGYWGRWVKYSDLSTEEVARRIDANEPYVIRFRSSGNCENKISVKDAIRGNLTFPENDLDAVIMKSDGLPTYHFAHVVDDHLMGTTHAIRGAEWLPSLPLHLQMFRAMGWRAPKYAHTSTIDKLDGGSRRKLSKRKDPEANVEFFEEQGYPPVAVIEYLMNIANSNFEDWRRQNPNAPYTEFKFELSKLPSSGALFDFAKLESIARDVVGRMSANEVFSAVKEWAEKHDTGLAKKIADAPDYARAIFAIERDGASRPRKDIAKWSDVGSEVSYFFDDASAAAKTVEKKLAEKFMAAFESSATNEEWFSKTLELGAAEGYAKNRKEYAAAPDKFKGDITAFVNMFRAAITGREQSPDLFAIMRVMGKERVSKRLGL